MSQNNPTIPQLKQFFEDTELPREAVLGGFRITNLQKFVDSHLSTLYGQKNNPKNGRYSAYYYRLVELRKQLITDKK